jgi:hypothetical protein
LLIILSKALVSLYEGYAQKGSGLILDGSPVLLDSTATSEPIEIPRSLLGGGNPRCHRARNPVDQEIKQHKQMNINDNQQPSGDKRSYIRGEGKAGNP